MLAKTDTKIFLLYVVKYQKPKIISDKLGIEYSYVAGKIRNLSAHKNIVRDANGNWVVPETSKYYKFIQVNKDFDGDLNTIVDVFVPLRKSRRSNMSYEQPDGINSDDKYESIKSELSGINRDKLPTKQIMKREVYFSKKYKGGDELGVDMTTFNKHVNNQNSKPDTNFMPELYEKIKVNSTIDEAVTIKTEENQYNDIKLTENEKSSKLDDSELTDKIDWEQLRSRVGTILSLIEEYDSEDVKESIKRVACAVFKQALDKMDN